MKTFLNSDEQKKITDAIEAIEDKSSAEVRVVILAKKRHSEKKLDIAKLAEKYFHQFRMEETKDRTGVLLLIHTKRKQFYIMGDEGIDSKIKQDSWTNYASKLSDYFKQGQFTEGIVDVLNSIGVILAEHFPKSADDTNELSNKVEFL